MDWPILVLGIVSISHVVGIIGLSIAYGYYHVDFLRYVQRLLELTLLFTLFFGMLLYDYVHNRGNGYLLIFFILSCGLSMVVFGAIERSNAWALVLGLSFVPIFIAGDYLSAVIVGRDPVGIREDVIVASLIFGGIGTVSAWIGAWAGKDLQVRSRLEDIGSGIRKSKERMNEFRTSLKQWEAEGYSGLKDIIAIKNLDQMEEKFSEIEHKIKKLKAVESTLKKLSQDFPDERAVFESEMNSIRKKYKDLSKVDEVEREIKNLTNELNRYYQLKNEILNSIAKVTYE